MSDKPYDQDPDDLPPAHPTEEDEPEPEPVVPEEPEEPA